MNRDDAPVFKAGEQTSASKLNKVVEILQSSTLARGQFQAGGVDIVRPQRSASQGSTPRFAICTDSAEAGVGIVGGPVTPGTGEATLYEYGSALGDDATAGETIEFENYMRGPVLVNQPIFVSERAAGIWIVHAEGCEGYPTES